MFNSCCTRYSVGDIAVVREWDDMVNEFGYDGYDIPTDRPEGEEPMSFVTGMRELCGKEFRIGKVDPKGWYRLKSEENCFFETNPDFWCVSDNMLISEKDNNEDPPENLLDLFCDLEEWGV